MCKDIIDEAAKLHYTKNVEGEPLDHNTPIDCFRAGAEFVINSKKLRNGCNPPQKNSYRNKINIMDALKEKDPHEGTFEVTGFHIVAGGDPSVGIPSASWELKNNFYFEDREDLENFRKELRELFEYYCGETPVVDTFEEYDTMIADEQRRMYEEFPVRYLIRDDEGRDMFMKPKPLTGMYTEDVAECIHLELEDWIKNSTPKEHIIPSTSQEYWDIIGAALKKKQRSLEVNSQHYNSNQRSIRRLTEELEVGFVVQKEYEKRNEVSDNQSTD